MSAPAPHYPQHPTPTTPAGKQKGSGLGVASLVLGIVGVIFCWIPFVGLFGLVLGIVAAVLGAIGFFISHRWMSLSGFILGVIALIAAIATTAAGVSAVDKAVNGPTPTVEQQVGENHAAPQAAKIGQVVHSGDFDFTVNGVSHAKSVGGEFGQTAQGEYTVLNLTIKNTGNDQVTFTDDAQKVVDTVRKQYKADSMAGITANSGNGPDNTFVSAINPGNSVTGKVVFDMPQSATADKVLLSGGVFGDASPATVRLR